MFFYVNKRYLYLDYIVIIIIKKVGSDVSTLGHEGLTLRDQSGPSVGAH